MATGKPKKRKKRLGASYFTSTISITLILFLLGSLSFILANAGKLSDYVKEKIGLTLVLHDNLKEVEILRLQKILNASKYVKTTRYVDKEVAAKELQEELGEDFSGFLGFNPLSLSIDVKLFAPYTNPDSLAMLEKRLMEYPEVKEVYYQKNLVSAINENVNKIGLFLLAVSGLLTVIFIALINNTIRITIYSKRFIINTMQLVGATRPYIRWPFIRKSIVYGIFGAVLSFAAIYALVFAYGSKLEDIADFAGIKEMGLVFLTVLGMGILISWFSTVFAVNKFLKMKFEDLFY